VGRIVELRQIANSPAAAGYTNEIRATTYVSSQQFGDGHSYSIKKRAGAGGMCVNGKSLPS
jgi:hypothetical protein